MLFGYSWQTEMAISKFEKPPGYADIHGMQVIETEAAKANPLFSFLSRLV